MSYLGQAPDNEWRTWVATPAQRDALRRASVAEAHAVMRRRRGLGQADPTPPPVRPPNWPVILGWVGLVGASLAILNGAVTMRANRRVRRNSTKKAIKPSHKRSWGSDEIGLSFLTDESGVVDEYEHARRTSRRGKKRRSTRKALRFNRAEMYELVYSTGGHGGPYFHKETAKQIAEDMMAGGRDQWIAIVRSEDVPRLMEAQAVNLLYRGRGWQGAHMMAHWLPSQVRRNTGRRSSHARPKSPKFSEMQVWESVARVRESGRPSEVAGVLPPGVAAKFKHLAPGLYKYGYGPKRGEAIVRFKNASLKGALTSTRIGAKAVGEYHWVVDNFDPKFPVVIRGIDDHGGTYWRVEEYAKQHARVPVMVKRGATSR